MVYILKVFQTDQRIRTGMTSIWTSLRNQSCSIRSTRYPFKLFWTFSRYFISFLISIFTFPKRTFLKIFIIIFKEYFVPWLQKWYSKK